MTRTLSVFDRHQIKIARSTLRMSELGASIMGGMNHEEARGVILKFSPRARAAMKRQRNRTS